jgi:hypothetical protein
MSDEFISLTDSLSLGTRHYYRGHVFVTTYGLDENKTEPFSWDFIFDEKDLSVSRQKGIDWFRDTIKGMDEKGGYFLPYASPENFVDGKNSCYSVVLSLIEVSGTDECEYDLLGTDEDTMLETMEIEQQIF